VPELVVWAPSASVQVTESPTLTVTVAGENEKSLADTMTSPPPLAAPVVEAPGAVVAAGAAVVATAAAVVVVSPAEAQATQRALARR
jgi:hypothetical protein